MNLGTDIDGLAITSSGTIIDDPKKEQIMLSTLLGVDFFFSPVATDLMVTAILGSSADQSKQSADGFTKRLAELIGKKEAIKVESARNENKENEDIEQILSNMFLFGNIDFKYDGRNHAYVADGKADLSFIKNKIINKTVDVKAEITKKRSGNTIDMFLSFDKNIWFYFSCKSNMMYTLSSNEEFNNTVLKLKSEDRKAKSGGFTFIASPASQLNRFIKKFGLSPIKTSSSAAGQDINTDEEVPKGE